MPADSKPDAEADGVAQSPWPSLLAEGEGPSVEAPAISAEILALYRQARAADPASDFKPWAMARAAALVGHESGSWIHGVMSLHGPVTHEVHTRHMRANYWELFSATLAEADPLGERMFGNPGVSFAVTAADFPVRSAAVMREFDITSAVLGMVADRSTGTFSVVAWHRGQQAQPFSETERRVHEQLLPHWVEGLQLYRVGVAMRELHATTRPGSLAALVGAGGLIHFAQSGFGELLAEEFEGWAGAVLPAALLPLIGPPAAGWRGQRVSAVVRVLSGGLSLVHLRRRQGTTPAVAREQALSTLGTSLDESDRALALATAQLQEQRRQQAVLEERQRIMRELHDGLGAHLTGLLHLAQRSGAPEAGLAEAVQDALDELRLTVDAAHALEGELVTLLGNLRYRLQPRLDAAGIALEWALPELPSLPALTSTAALHVQRIMLEAVTNVIRHARAQRIWVRAALHEEAGVQVLHLELADDGVGLTAQALLPGRGGRGLENMRYRAQALGAQLHIGPRTAAPGTQVELRWPMPAASAT